MDENHIVWDLLRFRGGIKNVRKPFKPQEKTQQRRLARKRLKRNLKRSLTDPRHTP